MDGETRTVMKLAEVLGELLRRFPDVRIGDARERERFDRARDLVPPALRGELPTDMRALRGIEVLLLDALEAFREVELPTDMAIKRATALAYYKEDMIRRKRLAAPVGNWRLEDEINAPGDDSLN